MSVLGIDMAKRVLHAVGMDERGKIVWRKRLSRHDLMPFLAKLPPVRIGMAACGGAHDWARRFRAHGHEVQRMAPQFVKPYGKSNKNDHIPPNLVVECITAQRKPPEVSIWRFSNQSRVGTVPPSTSTPHCPACWARR